MSCDDELPGMWEHADFMGGREEVRTGASTFITVEIAVHKEPTNEADPWSPPSARAVAAFVQERISHIETDDGWFAGMVLAVDSGSERSS